MDRRRRVALSVLHVLLACRPAADAPVAAEPFAVPTEVGETPSLDADRDALWMTWQERLGEGGRVRLARLAEGRWSEPVTVVESPRLLVNWADHPSVHADGRGGAFVHWLEQQPEGSAGYDVRLAHTSDGRTYRPLGPPHRDAAPAEHGFVSIAVAGDAFRVFWVDGREMVTGGPSAVWTATLSADGIGPEEVLDRRTCDCCATAAVATASGALVAYRDRSESEVRDVRLARPGVDATVLASGDGWTIDGCPVNGPALDATGDRVAAAWFTAAGEVTRVRAALSTDGGRTFGAPVDLAVGDAAREPLGRVDVAIGPDGSALVAWLEKRGAVADVVVRRLGPGGAGPRRVVAATAAERGSGFPKIETWDAGYLVAFTVPGEMSRVRAIRLRDADVPGE